MAVDVHGVSKDVTVEALLEAGLHFGHQTKRWNPKMKRFIFAERNGIYIIDLSKTLTQLKLAQRFLYETVSRGKKVLFVGTKKQAQEPLREMAEKLNQPYVVHRWLGGILTNNATVRKSVARMRELQTLADENGEIKASSKKEGARMRRELNKLDRNLSGVADMEQLPGAVFIVDCNREAIAVLEAVRLKIPVVALVDTNCDPDLVDFPIPGNDDAIRAIRLLAEYLGESIQHAANEYARFAAEEDRRRKSEEAAARAKAAVAQEEAYKRRVEQLERERAQQAAAAAIQEASAASAGGDAAAAAEPAVPQSYSASPDPIPTDSTPADPDDSSSQG